MKKILLATTFLVATAGFASAEISFGGSAAAGIAKDAGFDADGDGVFPGDVGADASDADDVAETDFETYSSATLAVSMSGETDGGLTFGADFDLTVGRSYTLADDDGFADEDAIFGMPTVWIDGAYGKISISDDNFDFFDDTNGGGDVMYEGTFGAIGVGLIADVDADVNGDPNFSLALDYTAGAIAAHADVDTYDLWNVSLAYTFSSFTAKIGTDDAEDHYIRGTYANNGIEAYAQYNALDDGNQWEVGGSFAKNGMSLAFNYDEAETYEVTAGFDLGGGLSLEAGVNETGDAMLGAAMTF